MNLIERIQEDIMNTWSSSGDFVVACGDITYMQIRKESWPLISKYDPGADAGKLTIAGVEVVSIPVQCEGYLMMERKAYRKLLMAWGREQLRETSMEQYIEMFNHMKK